MGNFSFHFWDSFLLFLLTYLSIKWRKKSRSEVQDKNVRRPLVSPYHILVEGVVESTRYFKLSFFLHFAVILVSKYM